MIPSLIVVTGGIGSGKTTMCKKLGELLTEYHVISFDEDITPEVWKDMDVSAKMLQLFGTLDKKAIKEAMFKDVNLRQQVDQLFGEKSLELMCQKMAAANTIFEIPLLYEFLSSPGGVKLNECILRNRGVVVNMSASTDVRMQRVTQRDSCSRDLVSNIIAAQASDLDRAAVSHITWDTTHGNMSDIDDQARYMLEYLSRF